MANQPQNQHGGGNQPIGQRPAQQPTSSNGFGSPAPEQKPAQQPVQSVAKEQGTSAPQQSPKAEPQRTAAWVPAFPAAPVTPSVKPEPAKATATLPLLSEEKTGGRRILTRGRVIAAIAALLIASMYLDRSPANAPEDKSSDTKTRDQLAAIGAQMPGPAAAPTGRVKAYFNNGVMDPLMACEKVFPVERESSEPSPEAVLRNLFAGPSAEEGNAGYFTSLSPGVTVKSVDIDNDTATVDLSAHAAWNVTPGSCRAQAIRAQITETMKQFTGVKDVAILVDGETENVLR